MERDQVRCFKDEVVNNYVSFLNDSNWNISCYVDSWNEAWYSGRGSDRPLLQGAPEGRWWDQVKCAWLFKQSALQRRCLAKRVIRIRCRQRWRVQGLYFFHWLSFYWRVLSNQNPSEVREWIPQRQKSEEKRRGGARGRQEEGGRANSDPRPLRPNPTQDQ